MVPLQYKYRKSDIILYFIVSYNTVNNLIKIFLFFTKKCKSSFFYFYYDIPNSLKVFAVIDLKTFIIFCFNKKLICILFFILNTSF